MLFLTPCFKDPMQLRVGVRVTLLYPMTLPITVIVTLPSGAMITYRIVETGIPLRLKWSALVLFKPSPGHYVSQR